MVYVTSDIHGMYDKFVEVLEMIQLKDEDTLYVLGDVVDRGPNPIRTLQKLMEMPNVVCIVGNHELMALEGLRFLNTEITEDSLKSFDTEMMGNLLSWQSNGCEPTVKEFRELDAEQRKEVIDFILDFSLYEELTVAGRKYLLVHSGLGDYSPEKRIMDYSLKNLVWDRADYDTQYFEDVFVVTGHTPTQFIEGNPKPGFIYRNKNHIAIDCGCSMPEGRLAAICLDTGEEFYSS